MSDPKQLLGKFVWFELVSRDPKKAQAFFAEVLGWRAVPFPIGGGATYDMIYVGDTMIGGYAEAKVDERPHWLASVSVSDVDAATEAAVALGAKVVSGPVTMPGAGRFARILDPHGAPIVLFKKETDDPPDGIAPHGSWLWNELHTTDPESALRFYEKVVGFEHRALDMGPAGTYFIVSKSGVDRGGVTTHLSSGETPHWLPYVNVDDVDATIARVKKLDAKIWVGPMDIPNIGRFGVFSDPTGAVLAVMKPLPRERGR